MSEHGRARASAARGEGPGGAVEPGAPGGAVEPGAPDVADGSYVPAGPGEAMGPGGPGGSEALGGPAVAAGAEERFEALIDDLCGIAGVTPPQGGSGFGRNAIRFEKKIFAMFVRGRLVVKLPRSRVDDLIDAGHGDRFDANKGTPMKEWFSLDPESALPWRPLALEALEFARPHPNRGPA